MENQSIGSRLKRAWNAFFNKDPTPTFSGPGYYRRPDRLRLTGGNERSIVTSVFNRIALDCAAISIKHVRLDENDRFVEEIRSGLDYCLNVESNLDQTSKAFIQDVVMSMMDEGSVAIVPVDTTYDPTVSGSFDVVTMRTGKIVEWFPAEVKVLVYNEKTGNKEELKLPKRSVCVIENPLYAVMNEPNSTLHRLMRKLVLLDIIDEQTGSGKLNLLVQLPGTVRSELRRQQAEKRIADIEEQLVDSKYGIAYTDGAERITQLNRSLDNNLLSQIEYLTNLLYSQLGITQSILDGTADEQTLSNYYERSILPILSAISDEIHRKFLTKTARTQRQAIRFFRDPFKLIPVSKIAEIADKFTRNEILTSNEVRQIIGMMPSKDPSADELRNKNLSQSKEDIEAEKNFMNQNEDEEIQNG